MKKIKIPSPKLKNTALCQLFFHLGIILFIPLMAIHPAIANLFGESVSVVYGISVLLILLANICINVSYFLGTYNLLSLIKAWQHTRLWYETDANEKTRAEAEKIIAARINKKGEVHTPVQGFFPPLCVRHVFNPKKSRFRSLFFRVDKICLLYSIERLDDELFSQIMTSARKNISAIVKEARKKRVFHLAACVIILADEVAIDQALLTSKSGQWQREILLPCAVDLSSGRYVFDSSKYPHSAMTASDISDTDVPVKNLAVDLMAKMLFGGKLPLDGNENFLEWDGISLETPFLDYMCETYLHGEKDDLPSEFFAHIIPKEKVLFRRKYLYFKTGKKTVAWEYELDKKDSKKIHVVSAYSYTVTPHITPLGKPERLEIQRKIRVYLEDEGYTVIFH